jgi:hypothetical protein
MSTPPASKENAVFPTMATWIDDHIEVPNGVYPPISFVKAAWAAPLMIARTTAPPAAASRPPFVPSGQRTNPPDAGDPVHRTRQAIEVIRRATTGPVLDVGPHETDDPVEVLDGPTREGRVGRVVESADGVADDVLADDAAELGHLRDAIRLDHSVDPPVFLDEPGLL